MIPESQLVTWSHQGAVTTARLTHESIRNALADNNSFLAARVGTGDYDVYLQGSYKNDTNIRSDSDVDLVVELKSTFQNDLSMLSVPEQQALSSAFPAAVYTWSDFRTDVISTLRTRYGWRAITEGNKNIKIAADAGRLPADVVACIQYRKYFHPYGAPYPTFFEGMAFFSRNDGRRVVNYPKLHYQNGVDKNASTNGLYKPTVRLFKNARTYLVNHGIISDNIAPSYFLESMLYNVPNGQFGSSYQQTQYSVNG